MRSETYKTLRLAIIVFSVSVVVLGFVNYANGQQQSTEQPVSGTPTTTTSTTTEVTPQQPQGVVIDPATATAIAGGSTAGVVAVVKSIFDQRGSKTRDKATDKDAGEMFALISKWVQCKKLYPNMTDSEILDLPISNNPYSNQTLGQAITGSADKWVEGNQTFWGIVPPKMSVPTTTTVEAVKQSTTAPPTQPPPPKAPANTSQTPAASNPTVGK